MRQRGKGTIEYERWRDKVARPYLEETYGKQCSNCFAPPPTDETGLEGWHDVDHIKTRGSRADLKMDLDNVRFLCGRCHQRRGNPLKRSDGVRIIGDSRL